MREQLEAFFAEQNFPNGYTVLCEWIKCYSSELPGENPGVRCVAQLRGSHWEQCVLKPRGVSCIAWLYAHRLCTDRPDHSLIKYEWEQNLKSFGWADISEQEVKSIIKHYLTHMNDTELFWDDDFTWEFYKRTPEDFDGEEYNRVLDEEESEAENSDRTGRSDLHDVRERPLSEAEKRRQDICKFLQDNQGLHTRHQITIALGLPTKSDATKKKINRDLKKLREDGLIFYTTRGHGKNKIHLYGVSQYCSGT